MATDGGAVVSAIQPQAYALDDVEEWLQVSARTLRSDAFYDNLRALESALPVVWLSDAAGTASSAEIADILQDLEHDGKPLHWVRTTVEVSGFAVVQPNWEEGYVGSTHASTGWSGQFDDSGSTGAIVVGRVHLSRFIDGDAVERSCAINTLAHEISHTLSAVPRQHVSFLVDTANRSRRPAGTPRASYVIGTTAQCTYLQDIGRIGADDLKDCVATFGISAFNNFACNDFPEAMPVRPDETAP